MTTAAQIRMIIAVSLLATLALFTLNTFAEVAQLGLISYVAMFTIGAALQFGLMRMIDRSRTGASEF